MSPVVNPSEKVQPALTHHNQSDMPALKDELLSVYREVYNDRLRESFFSEDRFWGRLEAYASRDGFSLIAARLSSGLIGFTLGFTLPSGSRWWDGLRENVPPDQVAENGRRTFAVAELMVRTSYRRRGYARALSAALLDNRTEERSTLLVRPENTAARTAYLSWGWRIFGHIQPFEDSPVYEVMLRDLNTSS